MSGLNSDEIVLAENAATEATLSSLNSKVTTVNTGAVVVSSSALPTGASTSANQIVEQTRLGDLTETAPATDTASSGLNGRLQRIAQRITSMIAALSDGTQRTRVTDGTNNAAVVNFNSPRANYGLVVRHIPYYPTTLTLVAPDVVLGNNKSLVAIQNTGTSTVRIQKIYLANTQTTAVTGVAADLRFLRIESFTGGTALNFQRHDTTDSVPTGLTAATGATVASESALYRQSKWSSDEWGPGTSDVESTDHATQELQPWYVADEGTKPITLVQNQGISIRCATNTTAGSFTITVVLTVDP